MEHMTSKRIAAEIRAIIARDQLSQSAIAKDVHLSDSQFSRRLHGHIAFSADEVAAIAKAIGTNVSVLYGETAHAA